MNGSRLILTIVSALMCLGISGCAKSHLNAEQLLSAPPSASDPGQISGLVWASKMAWTSPSNLAHSQLSDYPIGMGFSSWPGVPAVPGGIAADAWSDVAEAQAYGIDAFAFSVTVLAANWPSWEGGMKNYLAAASAIRAVTGKPFWVAPQLILGSATVTDTVSMLEDMLSKTGSSPAWPKADGRYQIWVYGGTSWPASTWASVSQSLESAGYPCALILDLGPFSAQLKAGTSKLADIDDYAKLPVAFWDFRTDSNMAQSDSVRAYVASAWGSTLANRFTIGTVFPGYWAPRNGYFLSGSTETARIRSDFSHSSTLKNIQITSWDDTSETHSVFPQVDGGAVRAELLSALVRQWRGQTSAATSVKTWVSHPVELYVGQDFAVEVLQFRPTGAPDVSVTLQLLDQSTVLASSTPLLFSGSGIVSQTYHFTVPAATGGKSLKIALSSSPSQATMVRLVSPPFPVWATDPAWVSGGVYRSRHPLSWSPEVASLPAPVLTVDLDALGVPQMLRAQFDPALLGGKAYFFADERLLGFFSIAATEVDDDLNATYNGSMPSWDRFLPVSAALRKGFFKVVAVSPAGAVTQSDPYWQP